MCSNLTSLEGAPKEAGRNFIEDDCYVNGRPIDDEDIEDITDVDGKIIIWLKERSSISLFLLYKK